MSSAKCFGMFLMTALLSAGCGAASGANPAGLATYTNSIGMEFVLIPAGTFMMGAAPGEKAAVCDHLPDCHATEREDDNWERPHQVTISRPFYMGKYEVTHAQWEAVMGKTVRMREHKTREEFREEAEELAAKLGNDFRAYPNDYRPSGRHPEEFLSWEDTQEFIRRLNKKEGHNRYRLPTEAEWEYAARAGATTAYFFGGDPAELERYAWFGKEFAHRAQPVGQKAPNPWGLYDMYGNVAEWVQDWAGRYSEAPVSDPQGPETGDYHMTRSCTWVSPALYCRSAVRQGGPHVWILRRPSIGFRIVLEAE